MNKKFISALLFGAMLIASTSTFVSCSYDDDIADLRDDLNATATDLNGLVDQKMKAVDAEIASLGAQVDALEAAYEAADEALEEAIANATNDAKGYADVQAAQAQAAAIDAAQKMVSDAQAALEAALTAVNTTLGEHGKSISALLEADKQLTSAIAAAQARADQAYALAEQAQKLATDNAAAIKSLNEALEGLKKTVANLEGQVSVLGEKVTALEKEAQAQAAEIAAQKAALKALEESNAKALDAAVKAAKDELLKEIEANSKKVADLEEKLAAAEAAAQAAVDAAKTALEAQIAEVAKKLAAESTAYTDEKFAEALEAAQAAQDDATAALNKLNDLASKEDLAKAAAEVKAAAAAAQTAANEAKAALKGLEDADKALAAKIKALEEVKDAYKDADKALKADLQKAITDAVAALKTELMGKIDKVNANLAYQGKKLKSLVFCPNLYYQGIEAVGVYSYNYTALTVANADVTKDQKTDAPTTTTQNVSVVPDVTFSYFLNPDNALVSENKANYNFILNNANYTRAISKSDISIESVKAENGKVNVVAKMHNADRISEIPAAGNGKVDVVALQYTDKNQNDTVITSDFAALKHYVVKNFIINKVAQKGKVDSETAYHTHLWGTAQQAIANAPMFEIAYKDDAIELDQWINVHYNNGSADQLWGGQATVNAKKFKLVYELIGYKSGSNATSESEHAKIDENNVLTTKGYNNEVTPAIVGRTPLLRVKLVDENSNKIAAVGYARILITPIKVDDMFVGPYKVTKPFNVACNDALIDLGKMMSWDKIENDVLAQVGLSRAQFDDLYKLDADGSGVAYQFALNASGNYVPVTKWGDVKETPANDAAHETDVLTWTVGNNAAYAFFKNTNNLTKSVIVRFVPENSADNGIRPVIYVTLSWTPSSRLVAPFASISDESKVYATWYAKNQKAQGKSDLHAHVNEAKSGNADEFDFSVEYSTFQDAQGNIVKPSTLIKQSLNSNGYTALANSPSFGVKYQFVTPEYASAGSAENKTAGYYQLKATDAQTLEARRGTGAWTPIATLNQTTGEITYLKNAVAFDILNYAKHDELAAGQTLTAKVQMVATTCAPASSISLSNHEMNVKFLRPLNVDGTNLAVVDANPSTHTIVLAEGNKDALGNAAVLNFTDWRDFNNSQVKTSSNNTTDLFTFYGVTSIVQDPVKKVKSNFAQGGNSFTDLSDSEFKFTYTCTGTPAANNMGTVTYQKITSVAVNEFTAKIPVIVTYDWGKLYAEIEVLVKPTVNNARENRGF